MAEISEGAVETARIQHRLKTIRRLGAFWSERRVSNSQRVMSKNNAANPNTPMWQRK